MNNLRTFILIFLIPVLNLPAPGSGWNVGVGGNAARNGLSENNGPALPLTAWDEGLSAVIAQQAVIDGGSVVMARIQSDSDVLHGTILVAHDLYSGDTLWTTELPVDFEGTDWRSRISAFRDGQVYATRAGNTNASYMYALDGATGAILWQSEALVTEYGSESATFAENGDLITTGVNSVVRISAVDGSTVWESVRICPTSGGCDPVAFGERVYLWEAGAFGPVITAFDVTDGSRLFSSQGIGGGFVQQVGLFVGPDGTVYAPRTQGNPATDILVALQDTGSGFAERWRVPLGYVPFASFGVGPDGSVYSYSPDYRVIRIEPVSGSVIDSSGVMVSDFYQPRMGISAEGFVFVTNGGFSQGALYSFLPNLDPLWEPQTITNVNVGGPALGGGEGPGGGVLIVCGTGTDVRAYSYDPTSANDQEPNSPLRFALEQNYPNPFNPSTTIDYALPMSAQVRLEVFNVLGERVSVLKDGVQDAGYHSVVFEADGLPSGIYFYRLQAGDFVETRKSILMK